MTRRSRKLGSDTPGALAVIGRFVSFRPNARSLRIVCLVPAFAAVFWQSPAYTQVTWAADPCDQTLVRAPNDPLAYGRRGERCEGLYIREVSGSAGLLLASFTEAFAPFEPAAGERLYVEWSPPKSPVRIRAVALRRRLYYRMDTTRPPGSKLFEWPGDVLASLKMRSQEIGIVGWTDRVPGSAMEEVYVPLRVGKRSPVERTGRYVLLVVPGTELSEVFVTLSEVLADGREGAVIKRDEPLGYGFYPAERGIRISLPALQRSGLYRLQVGATLSRGGSVSRSLLFSHPGN
jgi:hypothetical protein